ncbi:MAG: hypothetical protein KF894_00430 [Labilithrix sp.]|nr:hypothetical protein [Labilithrix sp.]
MTVRDAGAEVTTAVDGAQRTVAGLALVGGAMALLVVSSFFAPVRDALGVGPLALAVTTVAMILAIAMATVTFHRAGPQSRSFRVAERVESSVIVASLLSLAYVSSGHPLFWILYLVFALLMGMLPARAGFHMVLIGGGALLAALALAILARDPGGAIVALVSGAFGVNFVYILSRSAQRLAAVSAERERLAAELGAVRIEEERRRIARDLHDGVAGDLTALTAQIDSLRERRDDEVARDAGAVEAELEAVSERAARGVDDLRAVVWALREEAGSWNDTAAYTAARLAQLCPRGVELRVEVDAAERSLDGALRLHVVRALQESVRNAVRHGAPRTVSVSMRCESTAVLVEVVDDGDGMDAATLRDVEQRQVGGLANLRRRAAERGGAVSVGLGAGGRGLRVALRLPIAPPAS